MKDMFNLSVPSDVSIIDSELNNVNQLSSEFDCHGLFTWNFIEERIEWRKGRWAALVLRRTLKNKELNFYFPFQYNNRIIIYLE